MQTVCIVFRTQISAPPLSLVPMLTVPDLFQSFLEVLINSYQLVSDLVEKKIDVSSHNHFRRL